MQHISRNKFRYGNSGLETVDKYKYLGTIFNEHLNFIVTADVLAGAGRRSLGSVISKFSKFRNIGYTTLLNYLKLVFCECIVSLRIVVWRMLAC